jgi:hypothetical protein
MWTRSAKLDVAVTNGKKSLLATVPIAKDEILIDLNGEDTLPSPTRRSLQIGEGKHCFPRFQLSVCEGSQGHSSRRRS